MRKFFHNDTSIRVISVLISILLWMYVVGVNNPTVSLVMKAVPVRTINNAEFDASGLKIISNSVKSLDVKIEGRHSEVSKISANDILAQIDVSKITSPGNYELEIILNTKIQGVSFTNITANKTNVFVDYIISVNKDIEVETLGEPKEGFVLDNVVPQDKQVKVRGPKSHINKIKGAIAKIDISGADGTLSKNCAFEIVDTTGRKADLSFVTTDITETLVNVTFSHEKEIQIVPVFESSAQISGYDVRVSPEIVKIKGNADIVKSISKIETDLIKLPDNFGEQKTFSVDVNLKLSEGMSFSGEYNKFKLILTSKQ